MRYSVQRIVALVGMLILLVFAALFVLERSSRGEHAEIDRVVASDSVPRNVAAEAEELLSDDYVEDQQRKERINAMVKKNMDLGGEGEGKGKGRKPTLEEETLGIVNPEQLEEQIEQSRSRKLDKTMSTVLDAIKPGAHIEEPIKVRTKGHVMFWEDVSTSMGYFPDALKTRVCTFQNICVQGPTVLVPIQNEATRSKLQDAYAKCIAHTIDVHDPLYQLCRCFVYNSAVKFVKPTQLSRYPLQTGHTWMMDTFVARQFGHFVETVGFFHSIQLHPEEYDLPALDQIYFPKLEPSMLEHEKIFIDAALKRTKTNNGKKPELIEPASLCFERLSSSGVTALISASKEDAAVFRSDIAEGVKLNLTPTCPPARALFLLRSGESSLRRPSNLDAIVELVEELGVNKLEFILVSGSNSSAAQLQMFNSAGLILSSHSSQLVNLVAMVPGSAIVEITPAFHNMDFAQNAFLFDVNYHFSIGHTDKLRSEKAVSNTIITCNKALQACNSEGFECFQRTFYAMEQSCNSKEYRSWAKSIKYENYFQADLDALRENLKTAIKELNSACDGHWPGLSE